MFAHPSYIHGVGHTYRVMLLASMLAQTVGWEDCARAAIWAAMMHDTQRTSDAEDTEHGRLAVLHTLPRFREQMECEGMNEADINSVAYAMEMHCRDEELDPLHPAYRVALLLREADALDRLRFNGLDPAFLRMESTAHSMTLALSLFEHLMHHVVTTYGTQYRPLADYTLDWMRTREMSHVQFMNACLERFGDEAQRFFALLNETEFYESYITTHSVFAASSLGD